MELQPLQSKNTRREVCSRPDGKTVEQLFQWVTGVDYKGHTLNWLECKETISPTNIDVPDETLKTT